MTEQVPEEFTHAREKKEVPFSPGFPVFEVPGPAPTSDVQALMEAPPGHEPRQSKEGSAGMMEALHDAIDTLPPKQKWVIEAVQWRRLTFAEIGTVLGVSRQQAHRIYERALAALESHLTE